MKHATPRIAALAAAALAVGLSGCSQYVKKSDYDAAIAQLRQNDQNQQQQIDALSQQMKDTFAKYDARITQLAGRVKVDTVAHFGFNQSDLREQDKPMLDDFAKVIREHHSDALITVEGFADPAGSKAYNKRLGMKRAEAVRDYLVQDGLTASQVRAVSYGEASNRQVREGATRDQGQDNRRVSLVVDFAGNSQQGDMSDDSGSTG
ncbi:OmpA family protein [Oleiagrimonas sp. C23AA]|uniref:OmpA family protein n=1 Tax=Oleiagrimonas sp. C23AA TaxID=2719047 RepID=UPI00141ED9BE|nr:OmpA family protein [Oleiagrimonas sp. C23AA]NII10480.1 OmpA family protein [Oleiagrimonas sp. C23AA]